MNDYNVDTNWRKNEGRMTYRELFEVLKTLTDEQLDCDVTVEDNYENECYAGSFDICGPNHNFLEDNHPVIRF